MAAWKCDKASAICPAANIFLPISKCCSTSCDNTEPKKITVLVIKREKDNLSKIFI